MLQQRFPDQHNVRRVVLYEQHIERHVTLLFTNRKRRTNGGSRTLIIIATSRIGEPENSRPPRYQWFSESNPSPTLGYRVFPLDPVELNRCPWRCIQAGRTGPCSFKH